MQLGVNACEECAIPSSSFCVFDNVHIYTCMLNFTIQQDFVYPNNVAYPFGGEGHAKYGIIELHYDNPEMISGNDAPLKYMYCSIVGVLGTFPSVVKNWDKSPLRAL